MICFPRYIVFPPPIGVGPVLVSSEEEFIQIYADAGYLATINDDCTITVVGAEPVTDIKIATISIGSFCENDLDEQEFDVSGSSGNWIDILVSGSSVIGGPAPLPATNINPTTTINPADEVEFQTWWEGCEDAPTIFTTTIPDITEIKVTACENSVVAGDDGTLDPLDLGVNGCGDAPYNTGNLLANDTDPEGDPISICKVNGCDVTGGQSALFNGFKISVDAAGTGLDLTPCCEGDDVRALGTIIPGDMELDVTICDDKGAEDTGTVTIPVTATVELVNADGSNACPLNWWSGDLSDPLPNIEIDLTAYGVGVVVVNDPSEVQAALTPGFIVALDPVTCELVFTDWPAGFVPTDIPVTPKLFAAWGGSSTRNTDLSAGSNGDGDDLGQSDTTMGTFSAVTYFGDSNGVPCTTGTVCIGARDGNGVDYGEVEFAFGDNVQTATPVSSSGTIMPALVPFIQYIVGNGNLFELDKQAEAVFSGFRYRGSIDGLAKNDPNRSTARDIIFRITVKKNGQSSENHDPITATDPYGNSVAMTECEVLFHREECYFTGEIHSGNLTNRCNGPVNNRIENLILQRDYCNYPNFGITDEFVDPLGAFTNIGTNPVWTENGIAPSVYISGAPNSHYYRAPDNTLVTNTPSDYDRVLTAQLTRPNSLFGSYQISHRQYGTKDMARNYGHFVNWDFGSYNGAVNFDSRLFKMNTQQYIPQDPYGDGLWVSHSITIGAAAPVALPLAFTTDQSSATQAKFVNLRSHSINLAMGECIRIRLDYELETTVDDVPGQRVIPGTHNELDIERNYWY